MKEFIKEALALAKEERGFVYTAIGNVGSALLGAIFWLILASILSVSEYGEVNYYIAFAVIPAAVSLLGLNTVVTTYLAKGEKEIAHEADSITLISSLALAMAILPFQSSSSLILIAMVFFGMSVAEILGRRLYGEFALVSVVNKLLQIALSILLYFEFGLVGVLVGYSLAPLLLSYRYLVSLRKFTLKVGNLKKKVNFAIHSYGFNLIGSFAGYLDKLLIGMLFGFYALGIYQLGFQFFMFLGVIPASLYTYLLPEESSGVERREVKLIGLAFSGIAALTVFLASPWIVRTFFPKFVEAIQAIRIMAMAVIPAAIASILAAKLFGGGKSRFVLIGGIVYLTCLITGMVLLGRSMGVLGLALSVTLAQVAQAIYLWRKIAIF